MEHAKQLLSIPLSSLVPSPYNVRRHATTHVEELAALIDAQGLLQNLIVTEHVGGRGKARKVKFAVAAGERRRRAMLLLQQRGRLPEAHEVLCELVPVERGIEVSLAENSGREPMHPADEFEAFSALIADGKGVEDVAARFGVPPLTVQRRLRLAALSPKLLGLYREGGINLDQLMALTLSDDHTIQERTWFDAHQWDRSAASLRRVLTASDIAATGNAMVRFVGIERYEAAGGHVRRDLFDDTQSGYLADGELLRRLALDKLEALAAPVRDEGWLWVEARLDLEPQALRQFSPCGHSLREPTADEQADLDELDVRETELEEESESLDVAGEWSADDAERLNLEGQDIEHRRRAIQQALRTWTTDAMAHAGAIVTVGREGDAEILRGLVRPGEAKAFAATLNERRSIDKPQLPEASTERPHKAEFSEAMVRRLTAHRTAALQATLADKPHVALAALVHALAQRVFGEDHVPTRTALQVSVQLPRYALLQAADDMKGSTAWQALATRADTWRQRIPRDSDEMLAWLIEQPQTQLLDLLSLCVALTVNAIAAKEGEHPADPLAAALALDMADWWQPTAEGYLSSVSKAQIIEALNDVAPEATDTGMASLKKNELVTRAASLLAGKRWLPALLRSRQEA